MAWNPRGAATGIRLLLLALLVLIFPLQWMIAVVLAAAFHEWCHYLAVRLFRGQVNGLRIGMTGARMDVTGLLGWQELICILAGPAGGLMLLLLARWIPRTALCAAFQSIYNLLPIWPLDGGRALRTGADLLLPVEKADGICVWMERICLAALALLGLYGTFILHIGMMPLLFIIGAVLRKNSLQTVPVFVTIRGVKK